MYTLIIVLAIIVCALLIVIVLIQNPKGGGLSQSFGGISNQIIGVQRSTDVVEKGTWYLAIALGVLCLASVFFVPKAGAVQEGPKSELQDAATSGTGAPTTAPETNNANQAPVADSTK